MSTHRVTQETINQHEKECMMFKQLLKTGHIEKEDGAICDYYYINLINPKDEVQSHMIYKCPFCFAGLMPSVEIGGEKL